MRKGRGRPSKAQSETGHIAPAEWGRIRRAVESGMLDPIHGSQLGRLSYHREITDTQFEAGKKVGEIYGRFEKSIGKRRSARSPSYERGFSGQSPEAQRTDSMIEEAEQAKRAWQSLQDELKPYPRHLRAMLELLAVEDQAIAQLDLHDMRILLDSLAMFFGVVSAGKNRTRDLRPKRMNGSADATIPPKPNNNQRNFVQAVQRILGGEREFEVSKVVEAYNFYQGLNSRDYANRHKEHTGTRIRKP